MSDQNKTKYLDILQIFRGIAALMVVIHHAVGSLKYYHKIDSDFLNAVGIFGKLGVDFFFILSGFIISYSSFYKYSEPDSFKRYFKNRIIRVYVPYLPIGILMYLLYSVLPNLSNNSREISLITSFTLFPSGNPALSVAWTLSFELFFYFFFSLSFFSKKVWNGFTLLWLILIVIFNYSFLNYLLINSYPIFKVFFSTYNLEFLLGYLLSLIIIYKVKFKWPQYSIGILIVILLLICQQEFKLKTLDFYYNYLFALILFFVLYIIITYYNKKFDENFIMMHIGNASYSIYLIHNPLQMTILRLYPNINTIFSLVFAIVLVLGLSSLFGYLYYFIFEKKCMNYIKSKLIR
ncbi:acyltransferase family protein [Flavobacterium aquatile]|uniref:acyltransferase family protein n=1 Tax=Flavobacterium aquatile TaxID=245 RepID=UPI00068C88E2|nr:acyltransferase [Flavobacterium aquatile]OXA67465.1 acyltransferase [Flavobacterium aquatile] [Flavobacterium aquatile LMG 4008 = ATCC 11947]GEC79207.1 acyltransferase [Flavobacterium aquatile]